MNVFNHWDNRGRGGERGKLLISNDLVPTSCFVGIMGRVIDLYSSSSNILLRRVEV